MATESSDARTPVTVLGLGALGRALAGTFLAAGHPTTVWNRSAERAGEPADQGATVAGTPAAAIEASPLVVICVLDDDAVHQILDPVAGALAGRVLVNLTTGTPEQARRTGEWAAGHGAEYLDGGVMALPSMIGRPEAFILYSGSGGAFDAHEPVLGELGAAEYLGADPGRAALYDLALLTSMYGMIGGFLQAAALVGAEKTALTGVTPLMVRWLTAVVGILPEYAKAIESGDHAGGGSNLAMQAAGFRHLIDANRDRGVGTELIDPLRALLDRGVAAGHGAAELSILVELLRPDRR